MIRQCKQHKIHCILIQSTSLNPTPVNLSTRLSLGGHQDYCQQIVTTLSPTSYHLVEKLTGVELSEVDCIHVN